MNPYFIGAIVVALLSLGFAGGKAYEDRKVTALVAEARKEALDRVVQVNKDNKGLQDTVNGLRAKNAELIVARDEALAHQQTVIKDRIVYREKQREENPICAVWLDTPVPCRLRPDDAAGSGKTGAGKGSST